MCIYSASPCTLSSFLTLHTPICWRQTTEHTPTIIILWQINNQFQTFPFDGAFLADQFGFIPTILSESMRRKKHL
jgi:hypothetical protein